MSERYHDPAWLYEQLEVKERSEADVAEEFGVVRTTIVHWRREHVINGEYPPDGMLDADESKTIATGPTRMVRACVECDSADIQVTASSIQAKSAVDHRYRCNTCAATFDDPVARQAKGVGSVQGLARRLLEADPDDVAGPRPAASQTESDDVGPSRGGGRA